MTEQTISEKVEAYKIMDGLNSSMLKSIMGSIREKTSYDEDSTRKGHFIIGDAVECLLFYPEEFDSTFYVSEMKFSADSKLYLAIKAIHEGTDVIDQVLKLSDLSKADIEEGYASVGYNQRITDKKAHAIKHGSAIFDALNELKGKVLVTKDEKETIDAIVNSIQTNKFITRGLYPPKLDYIETIIQYPLQVMMSIDEVDLPFKAKCLLDQVVINHKSKQIRPWDLKTMEDPTYKFPFQAKKFRYDVQASFYTAILQQAYPLYEILPFRFLVESKKDPGQPIIYDCTEKDLIVGRYGNTTSYKVYEGWETAVRKYLKHKETNQFITDLKVLENGHILKLDLWN